MQELGIKLTPEQIRARMKKIRDEEITPYVKKKETTNSEPSTSIG